MIACGARFNVVSGVSGGTPCGRLGGPPCGRPGGVTGGGTVDGHVTTSGVLTDSGPSGSGGSAAAFGWASRGDASTPPPPRMTPPEGTCSVIVTSCRPHSSPDAGNVEAKEPASSISSAATCLPSKVITYGCGTMPPSPKV